jgi:IS30 family transposase
MRRSFAAIALLGEATSTVKAEAKRNTENNDKGLFSSMDAP